MSERKIVVLDAGTLALDHSYWKPFEALGDLVIYDYTADEASEIIERCQGATVVLSNKVRLSKAVMAALPDLKLVSVLATGTNNIDLTAAKAKGITVCNVPAYSTESVAQHTYALMLELCHRVGAHNISVHEGEWITSSSFSYHLYPLRELRDLCIGLLGFGAIGQRVAELLAPTGCKMLVYSRSKRAPQKSSLVCFEWASDLDELFSKADILSLHCPETDATRAVVDADRLAMMKPDAMIVNTSRGGLIDELALRKALENKTIAAAALDVISSEPMPARHPFLGLSNCILTPHLAWSSLQSRQKLLAITLDNIQGFGDGRAVNLV